MVEIILTPPGPPGKRVEYFHNKPRRHRLFVTLTLFMSVGFAWQGWSMWNPRRQNSILFLSMSLGVFVMSLLVWRHGRMRSRQLTLGGITHARSSDGSTSKTSSR